MGKYYGTYRYIFNRGSVTVEACFTVPLFLFFFLSIVSMIMVFFAEAHIRQSLGEACEYTSQLCYLEGLEDSETLQVNEDVLYKTFYSYLGEDFYIDKVILGGKSGISVYVEPDKDNKKIFLGKAKYNIKFTIPMIGTFKINRSVSVKQKGFVGYRAGEEEVCEYVYVTPNQAVYHCSRECTHLKLSVNSISSNQINQYTPCGFCGNKKNDTGRIYVARTTDIYHQDRNCSGLKRTVSRVKKSSVKGLSSCSRCGR